MIFKLVLSALLMCSLAAPAEAAVKMDDNLVVPGNRVGFITQNTTETELKALLPQNQIRRILYDLGEGDFHCATEIFPNSNKTAVIIWGSDKALYEPYKDGEDSQKRCNAIPQLTSPQSVMIDKVGTFWQTKNNIRVGMSLAELEKAHGKPIIFSICECDYGGNIMNWPIPKLYMHLDYANDAQDSLEHYVSSEDRGVKSSDVPAKLKSTIKIDKIAVYFDDTYKVETEQSNPPKPQ